MMRNEAPREERVLQVKIRDGVIAYLRALFQSSGLFFYTLQYIQLSVSTTVQRPGNQV